MSERSLWIRNTQIAEPPNPAAYRQSSVPPDFPTSDDTPTAKRFARKRVYFWFGVAVAFHVILLLVFFLTPKLRLKAGYASDRWVEVLPMTEAPPGPAPTVPAPASAPPSQQETEVLLLAPAKHAGGSAQAPAVRPPP